MAAIILSIIWLVVSLALIRCQKTTSSIDRMTINATLVAGAITLYHVDDSIVLSLNTAIQCYTTISLFIYLINIKESDTSKLLYFFNLILKVIGNKTTVKNHNGWTVINHDKCTYYVPNGNRLKPHIMIGVLGDKKTTLTGHPNSCYGFTPSQLGYTHVEVVSLRSNKKLIINSDDVVSPELINSM